MNHRLGSIYSQSTTQLECPTMAGQGMWPVQQHVIKEEEEERGCVVEELGGKRAEEAEDVLYVCLLR